MKNSYHRRDFLKTATWLPLAVGSGLGQVALSASADMQPIPRLGGSMLKVSLNAYSFSKLLNAKVKHGGKGTDLLELLEFCAKCNFDGFDPTGYFFPGYPEVPAQSYVNALKRKAFELGIGISGTGVRNNFTLADRAKRATDVQHIKDWVEVASRLGAPVLRVFADTQMRQVSWQQASEGHSRDEVAAWIAADLRECAEHGERFGVIIGVQNHGDFLKTADDLLNLLHLVNSDWCGAIVDTGYFKSKDPYQDMARVAPYAVNWQVKQSAFGAESTVPLDLKRFIGIVRASGYRGYLPIETLSVPGKAYDPYEVVAKFLAELREAIAQAA